MFMFVTPYYRLLYGVTHIYCPKSMISTVVSGPAETPLPSTVRTYHTYVRSSRSNYCKRARLHGTP